MKAELYAGLQATVLNTTFDIYITSFVPGINTLQSTILIYYSPPSQRATLQANIYLITSDAIVAITATGLFVLICSCLFW